MKRPPIKRIGISFIAMMAVTMAGCSIGGSDKASGGPDMVKKVRKRGTLRVAVLPDFPPTSVKSPMVISLATIPMLPNSSQRLSG